MLPAFLAATPCLLLLLARLGIGRRRRGLLRLLTGARGGRARAGRRTRARAAAGARATAVGLGLALRRRRNLLRLLLGRRAAGRAACGGALRLALRRGGLRLRAAARRGIDAERRDRLLVELAVGLDALGLLEFLQRLLGFRAHLAVGLHVQLGLHLLDGLGVMLPAFRHALRLAGRSRAFRLLRRGRCTRRRRAFGLLLGRWCGRTARCRGAFGLLLGRRGGRAAGRGGAARRTFGLRLGRRGGRRGGAGGAAGGRLLFLAHRRALRLGLLLLVLSDGAQRQHGR